MSKAHQKALSTTYPVIVKRLRQTFFLQVEGSSSLSDLKQNLLEIINEVGGLQTIEEALYMADNPFPEESDSPGGLGDEEDIPIPKPSSELADMDEPLFMSTQKEEGEMEEDEPKSKGNFSRFKIDNISQIHLALKSEKDGEWEDIVYPTLVGESGPRKKYTSGTQQSEQETVTAPVYDLGITDGTTLALAIGDETFDVHPLTSI